MQQREKSWMALYELFPFGPCSLLVKKGTNVNLNTFIAQASNISDTWSYSFEG